MSLFTTDTFTGTPGTLLENHTGESGAVWTKNPAFPTGSAALTAANRLRGNGSNAVYFESGIPASADYDVEADLYIASNTSSVGLLGRERTTDGTYYLFYYSTSGNLSLYTVVAGATQNTTNFPIALTAGQTYHLRLAMRGSIITCSIDGVAVISITDTNIPAAGRAGIFFGSPDTDSTGYHLDNFTASTPLAVGVTDANLFFSPYNWFSDGAGAMQPGNVHASSTFAQTNTPGAYLKFNWNAAASGNATLLLDTTPLSGITAANCPTLAISIDGRAFISQLLAYATGTTTLPLAANFPAGSHTIEIYFRSVTLNSPTAAGDRWTTPASVVKVTGLELDGKGSATAAQSLQARRMLVFGDSITEGADAVGGSNANADQDATQVYGQLLATGLGAEVGIVGFSAQGWATAGYGNVPKFYDVATPANSSFDQYSAGVSRLVSAKFAPAPDYLVVLLGHNDSPDLAVTAAVTAWLAAARADAPATPIFVVIPFDGSKRSAISAGFGAAADPNAFLIDLGIPIQSTMNSGGLYTNDAIHPNVRGHAAFATLLIAQLRARLGGANSFAASSGNFTGGSVELSAGAFAL